MAQKTQSQLAQTHVRVLFHLDPKNEQGIKTESVWAEPIVPGTLRIASSPFYVFGISAEDLISAREVGGVLEFDRLISKGGHSTYRLFLEPGKTIQDLEFQEHWQPISTLGATFENANHRFISVDIPPGKDIHGIYELLENGERNGVWMFEEGNYE